MIITVLKSVITGIKVTAVMEWSCVTEGTILMITLNVKKTVIVMVLISD